MEQRFCQSCGMPLTDEKMLGTNADGYPRPVPVAKIRTKGCHEIWMATGADSVTVADFKQNNNIKKQKYGIRLCKTV